MSLLTIISSILKLASKTTGIFNKARQIKEKITSTPSMASTPDELNDEINSLTDNQKQEWAELMQIEIKKYAKENERLDIEIGRIDKNITSKLSSDKADKIAVLRQTTRPWAVRMMVHYLFFPFYLVLIDIIQNILKNWLFFWTDITPFLAFKYVFGNINLETLSQADVNVLSQLQTLVNNSSQMAIAGQLYINSVPWATGIIVSYMGLREIGKAKGIADNPTTKNGLLNTTISDNIDTGIGLINKVRNLFKKSKK